MTREGEQKKRRGKSYVTIPLGERCVGSNSEFAQMMRSGMKLHLYLPCILLLYIFVLVNWEHEGRLC